MEDEKVFSRLRLFNLVMGVFHLVQALVMFALSNDFKLPVIGSFLGFDINRVPALFSKQTTLFDIPIGPAIALFLLLSAIAHFLIATVLYRRYVNGLKNNINKARWYEYALSSSLMIVIIAMLTGIYEIGALIALFGVNACMNLFGLLMEQYNGSREKVSWISYIFGVFAGLIPWIVIVVYFYFAIRDYVDAIPQFVYWILITIFLFFNSFAINMFLQYKKVGRWRNYLFGERVYIILSLVAKSALAWQIFFGTLRP